MEEERVVKLGGLKIGEEDGAKAEKREIFPFVTQDPSVWLKTFNQDGKTPLEFIIANGILAWILEPLPIGNGQFLLRPRAFEDYSRILRGAYS